MSAVPFNSFPLKLLALGLEIALSSLFELEFNWNFTKPQVHAPVFLFWRLEVNSEGHRVQWLHCDKA